MALITRLTQTDSIIQRQVEIHAWHYLHQSSIDIAQTGINRLIDRPKATYKPAAKFVMLVKASPDAMQRLPASRSPPSSQSRSNFPPRTLPCEGLHLKKWPRCIQKVPVHQLLCVFDGLPPGWRRNLSQFSLQPRQRKLSVSVITGFSFRIIAQTRGCLLFILNAGSRSPHCRSLAFYPHTGENRKGISLATGFRDTGSRATGSRYLLGLNLLA